LCDDEVLVWGSSLFETTNYFFQMGAVLKV
jgi:hypothetical protein